MTDHERATTGPQPASGPRPVQGAGPQKAAPASDTPPDPAPSHLSDPAPAHPPQPPSTLRRDQRHKVLAGVCSGLGRQCDMDPVIFRITLAVLSATGGLGLIFYGFAWLLVPYEGEEKNELRKLLTGRVDGQALTAVLFMLVGCGVFLSMLGNGDVLAFAVVLSLLLAGAGYWSRQRGAPDPDPLAAQAAADAPPEAQAPPVPGIHPSWWRDPIVKDGGHHGATGYLWGPGSGGRGLTDLLDVGLAPSWRTTAHLPDPSPPAPTPRGPRWIGGWVFLLALVAGAVGTRAAWDGHPLTTSLQAGLACALVVLGLGIAVSAFLGRTGAGSVLLAVLTAALMATVSLLPKDIDAHWIRATWQPATVADVRSAYGLGTGVGTLDLSHLDLTKGRTVTSRASVGLGRLRIIAPKNATLKLTIDVGAGDIQLPGDDRRDVDVAPGKHRNVTLRPDQSTGTLDLTLEVGLGQAEVARASS
ncbi:PspC domain-containing protein [Streptomyces sp. NPDC091279]|uniref:PspC domain-containing protein n=1 Tax=Streptomyces sp. NPDC091279 TaxID=3365983 RepID=UPI00381F719B